MFGMFQPGKSGAGKRISTTDFICSARAFSPPAQRLFLQADPLPISIPELSFY